MKRTKVFRNGGSLAVRLPLKYRLPLGDVMIEERNGGLMIMPLDDNGWPDNLETLLAPLADLDVPVRAMDSKPVDF